MKRIVFTGGGSAGHVIPNLALISKLKEERWDIHYIGSKSGIERDLIKETGIPYHPISSGKLRRYVDIKNFQDPFRVLKGIGQAYGRLKKLKPDVVFSKGGFVSVPVVIAAWLNRIPVFVHESDITPGLANKIATKFATNIFVTFEEAKRHLPGGKAVYTGSPIRDEIIDGNKEKGLSFLGFTDSKPVITVMGGSLGSKRMNEVVRESLAEMTEQYQFVHLCGKGNIDPQYDDVRGYHQFEYVNEEIPDILNASDLIVSRAGSNAIFEFLTLKKPMLLIPLPKSQSRGDQILNAREFENKGFASVLNEEELNRDSFMNAITELQNNQDAYIETMRKYAPGNSIEQILQYIKNA